MPMDRRQVGVSLLPSYKCQVTSLFPARNIQPISLGESFWSCRTAALQFCEFRCNGRLVESCYSRASGRARAASTSSPATPRRAPSSYCMVGQGTSLVQQCEPGLWLCFLGGFLLRTSQGEAASLTAMPVLPGLHRAPPPALLNSGELSSFLSFCH